MIRPVGNVLGPGSAGGPIAGLSWVPSPLHSWPDRHGLFNRLVKSRRRDGSRAPPGRQRAAHKHKTRGASHAFSRLQASGSHALARDCADTLNGPLLNFYYPSLQIAWNGVTASLARRPQLLHACMHALVWSSSCCIVPWSRPRRGDHARKFVDPFASCSNGQSGEPIDGVVSCG